MQYISQYDIWRPCNLQWLSLITATPKSDLFMSATQQQWPIETLGLESGGF